MKTRLRLRANTFRIIITALLFTFVIVSLRDRRLQSAWENVEIAETISRFHTPYSKQAPNPLHQADTIHFWRSLQADLLAAHISANPVKLVDSAGQTSQFSDPNDISHPRHDGIEVQSEDVVILHNSHTYMVKAARNLAPTLPFRPRTRGIVMTAAGAYFGVAITSIRMLRRTGSQLPIEVFLNSKADYDEFVCEKLFPELNARCFILQDIWSKGAAELRITKYQYKIFALLFTSFEDMLFLDADAFPAHNPDDLLLTEPFKSSGLVTWPDFWRSTASHIFYDIAGMPVPPVSKRRSSESGILLISKRKHAETLILAAYYNYYGPDYYYPLLSQGAAGEGDKETFLHAALALDLPFYDVQTPVAILGHWINGTWITSGMKQGDPKQDYALQNQVPGAKSNTEFGGSWLEWWRQSHSKDGEESEEDKGPDQEDHPKKFAKPLFIHNNLIKLDARKILEDDDGNPLRYRDANGRFIRLWGGLDEMKNEFGFDVERVLWDELRNAACQLEPDGKACQRAQDRWSGLFGEGP